MIVRMCSKGKTRKIIERGTQFIEFVAENKKETEVLRTLFNGHVDENGVLKGRYRVSSFGYDRKMPKMSMRAKKENPEVWSKILAEGATKQALTFEEIPIS